VTLESSLWNRLKGVCADVVHRFVHQWLVDHGGSCCRGLDLGHSLEGRRLKASCANMAASHAFVIGFVLVAFAVCLLIMLAPIRTGQGLAGANWVCDG
jgi:hypothetical protein